MMVWWYCGIVWWFDGECFVVEGVGGSGGGGWGGVSAGE